MVVDRLTDEIRQGASWSMMFVDDTVICSDSKEQVGEKLASWRYALERRGMKVNRRKTEYVCVNERQDNGTVRMRGEEVATVDGGQYPAWGLWDASGCVPLASQELAPVDIIFDGV